MQPAFDPNDLPPISYVCNSPGEENVIDDKPGNCPKSKAPLAKVRIDIAYKCLRGPADIQDKPAPCYANAERGPVTVSVFWTCKGASEHYLEPGVCADKSPREKGFEERPHGDHNPRHGGLSVFMSKDLWHHVEGTLVAPDVFRVYFYNEFTRPIPPNAYSAFAVVTDGNFKETGAPIPLTASRTADGNAIEGHIKTPAPAKSAVIHVRLRVKFKAADEDFVTDYQFSEYSKEPVAAKPATSQARPPAPMPMPAPAAKPPAPKPAAPKPAPATPSVSGGVMSGSSAPDLSGAGFTEQEPLPDTAPELLALLVAKREEVRKGLDEGQLGGVWLPALRAKDAAIVLEENHVNELADSQRAKLTSAVKQLTVIAWQIDAAGDLGNAEKLNALYQMFAAAVSDIQSLYAPAR